MNQSYKTLHRSLPSLDLISMAHDAGHDHDGVTHVNSCDPSVVAVHSDSSKVPTEEISKKRNTSSSSNDGWDHYGSLKEVCNFTNEYHLWRLGKKAKNLLLLAPSPANQSQGGEEGISSTTLNIHPTGNHTYPGRSKTMTIMSPIGGRSHKSTGNVNTACSSFHTAFSTITEMSCESSDSAFDRSSSSKDSCIEKKNTHTSSLNHVQDNSSHSQKKSQNYYYSDILQHHPHNHTRTSGSSKDAVTDHNDHYNHRTTASFHDKSTSLLKTRTIPRTPLLKSSPSIALFVDSALVQLVDE